MPALPCVRTPRLRAAVILITAGLVVGCGGRSRSTELTDGGGTIADAGETTNACGTEVSVNTPPFDPPSTRWGSITIVSSHDQRDDATGAPKSQTLGGILASFRDYSNTVRTPAQTETFGVVCARTVVGSKSEPRAHLLSAGTLTVAGDAGEPTELIPSSAGDYILVPTQPIDAATTQLVVSAPGTPGGFGAFELSLPNVPSAVELTAPQVGSARLSAEPLVVRWTPADADYVLVTLAPEGGPLDQTIVCRIADDGCFEVPADVQSYLRGLGADSYELLVGLDVATSVTMGDERVDLQFAVATQLTLDHAP